MGNISILVSNFPDDVRNAALFKEILTLKMLANKELLTSALYDRKEKMFITKIC